MSDLLAEVKLIRDEKLKLWVARYLDGCVPPYFFTVPASSSGKYHPPYALGVGGLVRHTKAVVQIAEELLQLEQYQDLNINYHDEIITACIIHDTFKHGSVDTGHTVFDHPNVASECFEGFMVLNRADLPISQVNTICHLVRSHMGQWNTSPKSDVVLDKPITREQQFVHMCDYLASRRNITVRVE